MAAGLKIKGTKAGKNGSYVNEKHWKVVPISCLTKMLGESAVNNNQSTLQI